MTSNGRKPRRPRVVILGGGYGGAYCAQALARLSRRHGGAPLEVWLIDRHNYFVFYPLLVEAGTGSLEPRHTVVPIRDFIPAGEFRMGEILEVDLANRLVTYKLIGDDIDQAVEYDHLVISLGSVTRLPVGDDPPGVREHAFEMKSLGDAVELRDHAIRMLELANAQIDERLRREMLHFVVVGGNFSGVEVAGEFDEFLKSASRHYEHVRRDECRVTLVELGDRILAPLGDDLSAFALRTLRKRHVDVVLKGTVAHADDRSVTLTTGADSVAHVDLVRRDHAEPVH